jgi:hypothetical protein
MINKYYSLTDDSIIYRIAMCKSVILPFLGLIDMLLSVLHPQYKTLYFNKAKWPKEWITMAEELLHEQWTQCYRPEAALTPSLTAKTGNVQKADYFVEIDNFGKSPMTLDDPITEWLTSPPLVHITDPIAYWSAMDAAGHPLARMSLDFLSVPRMLSVLCRLRHLQSQLAASTDVERAFSCGGLTVSKMCHSLKDESVRAATLVGSWVSFPGVILHDELVKTLDEKSKRPKGKGVAPTGPVERGQDIVEIIIE